VVAADLDGTLLPMRLDETNRLSPLTVAAVDRLAGMGIPTILVTGRMFRSAAAFAKELGLTGPVAAYQGALIRDVRTSDLIHHDPVPLALARDVLRFVESELPASTLHVYVDDRLYVAEWNEHVERYERLSGMKAHIVGSLSGHLQDPATKIGVGGDPAELDRLLDRLRVHFDTRLGALKTWPFFLEMTSPTATKARALQVLGARMGFTADQVLAFGDSYNDADMLAWAGTGVAMGGAPAEVVAAADVTCEPVDDDGFARYLSRQPWFAEAAPVHPSHVGVILDPDAPQA